MTFTDLDAWKEARNLVKIVYTHTELFPKEEVYGLQSQIRRSAISVPSNIAEGCGRNHPKDIMRFYYIAVALLTNWKHNFTFRLISILLMKKI